MGRPRVLYWFRTDLRLHDNPALQHASSLNPEYFWPIWCFDPCLVFHGVQVGPNRWKLDSQQDLSNRLTALNPKSNLFVLRGNPVTIPPALFSERKITNPVLEKATEPYALERDSGIQQACKCAGRDSSINQDILPLWDVEETLKVNKGHSTLTHASLMKAVANFGPPEPPLPPPTNIPDPGPTELIMKRPEHPIRSSPDLYASYRTQSNKVYDTISGPNCDFSIPTLEELSISSESATTPHRGGESQTLKNLPTFISDKKRTAQFRKLRLLQVNFFLHRPPSSHPICIWHFIN